MHTALYLRYYIVLEQFFHQSEAKSLLNLSATIEPMKPVMWCYVMLHTMLLPYQPILQVLHYDIINLLYFHTAVTPRLISTSVIRLALLYSNSDNPVVKAAATSTVAIATQQSPSRVESVRQRFV